MKSKQSVEKAFILLLEFKLNVPNQPIPNVETIFGKIADCVLIVDLVERFTYCCTSSLNRRALVMANTR